MADDVQIITGVQPPPEIAARLCNFVTAKADLLASHKTWLDANVRPAVMKLNTPWVDLFGYASRLGKAQANQMLSEQRCAAVKAHVRTYRPDVQFPQEIGKGEVESDGSEDDNSGYWRAVSVFVYGGRPAVRPKIPKLRTLGATQFKIRLNGGVGLGKNVGTADFFIFQIADPVNHKTAFYWYAGGGLAVPVPNVPGSMSFTGPFVNFRTTKPVFLPTFEGEAGVDQPTSITVGPKSSKFSVLDLTIAAEPLKKIGAIVLPRPVTIPTGSGLGVTVKSGTIGRLTMFGNPGVVPFP